METTATAAASQRRTGTESAKAGPMIHSTSGSATSAISRHNAAPPAGNHRVERIRCHTSFMSRARAATGTSRVVKVLLASMIGWVQRLTPVYRPATSLPPTAAAIVVSRVLRLIRIDPMPKYRAPRQADRSDAGRWRGRLFASISSSATAAPTAAPRT